MPPPPGRPALRGFPPWRSNRRVALIVGLVLGALLAVVGWGDLSERGAVGAQFWRLLAFSGWLAISLAAMRSRPAPAAAREGGARVLRLSRIRRYVVPALFAVPAVLVLGFGDEAGERPATTALLITVVVGFSILLVRSTRQEIRITDTGLDGAFSGGRKVSVRFATLDGVWVLGGRRAAVVVRAKDGTVLPVGAWMDGAAELARVLLERAPAAAIEEGGSREGLERLAAEGARGGGRAP
jgi:hypothetical protein